MNKQMLACKKANSKDHRNPPEGKVYSKREHKGVCQEKTKRQEVKKIWRFIKRKHKNMGEKF